MLFLGHVESGGCTEMRVMARGGRRIIRGYYDDAETLCEDALELDGKESVYLSLNPVRRDLLARSCNKPEDWAKIATSDAEILCDSWVLIDADPNRPSGICSTEEELKLALGVRDQVADWVRGELGAKVGEMLELMFDKASSKAVDPLAVLDMVARMDRLHRGQSQELRKSIKLLTRMSRPSQPTVQVLAAGQINLRDKELPDGPTVLLG